MLRRYVMMIVIILVLPFSSSSQSLSSEELAKLYASAIEDTRVARPDEIVKTLTAITSCNTDLQWDDNPDGVPRVRVATWVNQDLAGRYQKNVNTFTQIPPNIPPPYVTVVPEVRNFCRDRERVGGDLPLRLKQLLGLPPDSNKFAFVELLVDPRDLSRPCPDPEITDSRCEIEFRLTGFLIASPSYVAWFDEQKANSYGPKGYPWTRLGYTYDWGSTLCHIGLSEFIITPGANVKVTSVTATADYCARSPS